MAERLDRHDVCRLRDDIATILMAVTSMKTEVTKSDMKDYAKLNMERHMENIIDNLNFLIVILLGMAKEEER
jgi:hypothetical protein